MATSWYVIQVYVHAFVQLFNPITWLLCLQNIKLPGTENTFLNNQKELERKQSALINNEKPIIHLFNVCSRSEV